MGHVVTQIVIKGLFSLLIVWGLYRLWPKTYHAGNRAAWYLALLLVAGVMAALWRTDLDASRLFALPARLLRSAVKTLSSAGLRDPDGVYQHGTFAALGDGAVPDVAAGRVTFKALSHANHLDLGREIEYRSWRLKCPIFGGVSDMAISGTSMRVYTDVRCEIVGKRPVS
jgi:hypothetical protein